MKRKKINTVEHAKQCKVCLSPHLKDIELDYLHCIPWVEIERRWDIKDASIERHALAFGLSAKRDRKSFYWKLIEKVPLEKMTVENALEAAKQLDRLEHKLTTDTMPSNIQVVYSFGSPIGASSGSRSIDDQNRLRPVADPTTVSPVDQKV